MNREIRQYRSGSFEALVEAFNKRRQFYEKGTESIKRADLLDEKKGGNWHSYTIRLVIRDALVGLVQRKEIALTYKCIIDHRRETMNITCSNDDDKHFAYFSKISLSAQEGMIKEEVSINLSIFIKMPKIVKEGLLNRIEKEHRKESLLLHLPEIDHGGLQG
jgi:hypothetical protein